MRLAQAVEGKRRIGNFLHRFTLSVHHPDVTQVALGDVTAQNEHFVAADVTNGRVSTRSEFFVGLDHLPFARSRC